MTRSMRSISTSDKLWLRSDGNERGDVADGRQLINR